MRVLSRTNDGAFKAGGRRCFILCGLCEMLLINNKLKVNMKELTLGAYTRFGYNVNGTRHGQNK